MISQSKIHKEVVYNDVYNMVINYHGGADLSSIIYEEKRGCGSGIVPGYGRFRLYHGYSHAGRRWAISFSGAACAGQRPILSSEINGGYCYILYPRLHAANI